MKGIKSMKQYRFGFSSEGLFAFLLAMLPNIIWALIPPANDVLSINRIVFPVWDVIASISQWLMIAALAVLINQSAIKEQRTKMLIGSAALCLAGYYLFWILYYTGVINLWLFVGMAVLPTAYFLLVALWLKNYIAVIPAALFGVIHITLSCITYFK